MFYFTLFLYVFFVAASMAEVKKEFGEFKLTHHDSIQSALSIERFYSSRSLYKGYFGSNWCSPLDYKLSVAPAELSFFDCETGRIRAFEKTGTGGYWNQETKSAIAVSGTYFRYASHQTVYFFSPNGLLSHWVDKGKLPVYVIYRNNVIAQLLIKNQPPLLILTSPSGLIQKIGAKLVYNYNQGLLKSVLRDRKQIWTYNYDEFLNMTFWRGLTNFEHMKYDSEWDRIVYLKDKNNCRFHFQYKTKDAKKFILESEKCINTNEHNTVFEIVSQNANPTLIVKSPSDTLGKEFRNADANSGATDAQIY